MAVLVIPPRLDRSRSNEAFTWQPALMYHRTLGLDQALAAREVVYAREQRQKSGMNVAYSW